MSVIFWYARRSLRRISLISNPFLNLYNQEQVWATKVYVYIKTHPVFHLEADEWDIIKADFTQFWRRIHSGRVIFHDELVGRVFQLLLMGYVGHLFP